MGPISKPFKVWAKSLVKTKIIFLNKNVLSIHNVRIISALHLYLFGEWPGNDKIIHRNSRIVIF